MVGSWMLDFRRLSRVPAVLGLILRLRSPFSKKVILRISRQRMRVSFKKTVLFESPYKKSSLETVSCNLLSEVCSELLP